MIEEQKIIPIQVAELIEKVKGYSDSGFRLVQIGCTKSGETFEINYSFDKDYRFENLKVTLPDANVAVPSITGIYWAAFLYENEIHDLFGVMITGINIDYKGNFYRTSAKKPFNPDKT